MSVAQPYRPRDAHFLDVGRPSYVRNNNMGVRSTATASNRDWNYDTRPYNSNTKYYGSSFDFPRNLAPDGPNYDSVWLDAAPSSKRRKVTDLSCESRQLYKQEFPYEDKLEYRTDMWQHIPPQFLHAYRNAPVICEHSSGAVAATISDDASAYALTTTKRDTSKFEDDEKNVLVSRYVIERCSPSRKDGIDALHETHLRYTYCAFLQNLGAHLDLPQTTTGTSMVLCHRFFFRRSHATHDRFLIATAALFLASKSEETPRPLNDVLRASCEIIHEQDFSVLSYMLPVDWFEQYRERITEAEQLILTTLNFELDVQHPYESLTSTLQELGFSQSVLVNLALSLVSEGLRSSLWLQFKPHQIAAGAAYLAAKFLNMNLASCHNVWHAFHTPPCVLRDIAHQLMEML